MQKVNHISKEKMRIKLSNCNTRTKKVKEPKEQVYIAFLLKFANHKREQLLSRT